jgi:nucleosome binding factor SPN SPT16 subunit
MASRTLLFNAKDGQKNAYNIAFDAHAHLVSLLTPGAALDAVYSKTLNYIKQKDASLAEKVHTNFGFGIGCKYKEEELSINNNNVTKVEPGMVFHVRITFKDVEGRGPIAIGDTVIVEADSASLLTGKIPRKFTQISYTLDDEDESEGSEEEEKNRKSNRMDDD